ncbi:hypothetical protein BH10BDE1_BH10BDE1_12590 [soil metagenome]
MTKKSAALALILAFGIGLISIPVPADALPASEFVEGGFYKITNNSVGGQELALTFILPTGEGINQEALTNNASKSRIALEKFKVNEKRQLWQFTDGKVIPGHTYIVYTKFSDAEDRLTGALKVINADNAFSEDKKYQEKYNRITVGPHAGESEEYWIVTKVTGGKWQIMNMKGHEFKKPKESAHPYKWNESRSLEAFKMADGTVSVRNGKTANVPAQQWTITKVAQ